MNKQISMVFLFFMFSFVGKAQFHINLIDDLSSQRINDSVSQIMLDSSIVGMAVAIVYDRQVIFTNSYGWAEENDIPFAAETKVRWASISKTITGLIATKLWQDGNLDVDNPVVDYIPEFDNPNITVRDLFHHQSGIEHYSGTCDPGYSGAFVPSLTASGVDSCSICYTPAGSAQLYTSFGTNLLGAVIDTIGKADLGMGYYDLYQNWIRNPYNLLSLEQDSTNIDGLMSKGYTGPGVENVPEDVGWKLPSGGFMSNIVDMGKYMEMVLNNNILSPEYYDSLWTNQPLIGSPNFSCDTSIINESSAAVYGVQWRLNLSSLTSPTFRASHGGSNPTSSKTTLHLLPNKGIGIGILCNTTSDAAGDAVNKLRAILENIVDCPENRSFTSLLVTPQTMVFEAANQIDMSNWNYVEDSLYIDSGLIFLREGFRLVNMVGTNLFIATDDGCGGSIDPGN